MYVPILMFYPKPDHLKESLSQTLSHFYHFGGRYKDACTLECNDSGAYFVTTLVDKNIDEFLQHPKCDSLKQLIPYKLGTSIALNLHQMINHFTFSASNGCILLDTKDYSGIEVMLSLGKEEMERLEENKEFLAYASLNQSL
ncbi:hypothetical protein LIER_25962 [Lithospermum erythrorhizon]|uniref:Uncharacterized protein n=1 Tax=Lithospermum erythrorhizon TaxID=34254 RepID=A0AAV3R9X9_LITER